MRKVAFIKVVCIPEAEIRTRQIVTIGDDDTCSCASLLEETERTEWLPGIAVLSPIPVERKEGEDFYQMIRRLCRSVKLAHNVPYRVYWISPFDAANMLFLPFSRISILFS